MSEPMPEGQRRALVHLLEVVFEHRAECPVVVREAAARCVIDLTPLRPDELNNLRELVGLAVNSGV